MEDYNDVTFWRINGYCYELCFERKIFKFIESLCNCKVTVEKISQNEIQNVLQNGRL